MSAPVEQKSPFATMMGLSAGLPTLVSFHFLVPRQIFNPKMVYLSDPKDPSKILASFDITKENPTHTYSTIKSVNDLYLLTVKTKEGINMIENSEIEIKEGRSVRIILKENDFSIRYLDPIRV